MKRAAVGIILGVLVGATSAFSFTKTDVALIRQEFMSFLEIKGAIIKSRVWNKPEWKITVTKELTVCWENLADSNAFYRAQVKDALNQTWARYSLIRFKGWETQCPEAGVDIRIGIGERSVTQYLGNKIQGLKDGVTLRMDYAASPFCQSKPKFFCERATAVHEFGHALSLSHEQNRDERKDFCPDREEGEYPDFDLTEYDEQSIMNYCNASWNNDGLLSDKDIQSIRKLYGVSDIM